MNTAILDEYGKVDSDLASLDAQFHYKNLERRKEALRETILSWHADLAADAEITEHGERYDVIVTARDNKREVTPAGARKLYKLWGAIEFFKRCAVALKTLPDPKDAGNVYSIGARNGPRHLKSVPRAALDKAA